MYSSIVTTASKSAGENSTWYTKNIVMNLRCGFGQLISAQLFWLVFHTLIAAAKNCSGLLWKQCDNFVAGDAPNFLRLQARLVLQVCSIWYSRSDRSVHLVCIRDHHHGDIGQFLAIIGIVSFVRAMLHSLQYSSFYLSILISLHFVSVDVCCCSLLYTRKFLHLNVLQRKFFVLSNFWRIKLSVMMLLIIYGDKISWDLFS